MIAFRVFHYFAFLGAIAFSNVGAVFAQDAGEPQLEYSVSFKAKHNGLGVWLNASLKNRGESPVRVYWGDRAHPDMYQFKVVHLETGRRIPLLGSSYQLPTELSKFGDARYFEILKPGGSLSYDLAIGDTNSGNSQYAVFREGGRYEVTPALHVVAEQALESNGSRQQADPVSEVPVWTGDLRAESFVMTLPGVDTPFQELKPLAGKVLSADGKPVKNAIVQLSYSKEASYNWRTAKRWDNVFTNEAGEFEFPKAPSDADFSFTVTHPEQGRGYLIHKLSSVQKGEAPVVRMPSMVRFAGRVIDKQDGNGIPGVRVNEQAYTDKDGYFSFKIARLKSAEKLNVSLWRRDVVRWRTEIPWSEALSGKSELQVDNLLNLRLSGRAVFADGSPASDCKLTIDLLNYKEVQQAPNFLSQVRATTDANGHFTVSMPNASTYRAKATLEKNNGAGYAANTWHCDIAGLQLSAQPVELEFDNRGSIVLRLFQLSDDRSRRIVLSCESMKTNRNVSWMRVDGDSRGHVYTGLEPGKYRVSAHFEQGNSDRWNAEVIVPSEEPCRALAVIKIPKVFLGDLKGRLLMPDGKTPAENFTVQVGKDQIAITDESGVFEIKGLQKGYVACRVQPKNGMILPAATGASISTGEVVDLGDLRLVVESKEFGRFAGKLVHDDQTEVEGYRLLELVDQFPYGSFWGRPIAMHSRKDLEDGLRARRGKKLAVFDVFGTGRPRNELTGGITLIGEKVYSSVVLNVEIQGGKKIERTAKIPRRSQGRSLAVHWKSQQRPNLTVLVPLGDDASMVYELESPGFVRMQDGKPVAAKKSFEFQGVAKGNGLLIARGVDDSPYSLLIPFKEDQESVEVDPGSASPLHVSCAKRDGTPVKDAVVRIATEFWDQELEIAAPMGMQFGAVEMLGTEDKPFGIRLAPQTYEIELLLDGKSCKHQFRMENRPKVVRFEVDEQGKISSVEDESSSSDIP